MKKYVGHPNAFLTVLASQVLTGVLRYLCTVQHQIHLEKIIIILKMKKI